METKDTIIIDGIEYKWIHKIPEGEDDNGKNMFTILIVEK